MAKSTLHLSIDSELLEIAKNMDLNLSSEFEEWIRIRAGQNVTDTIEKSKDYDKEYARLQLEMQKLQSQKELADKEEQKQSEILMLIDHTIDNELEITPAEQIPEKRAQGLAYLFKQKFKRDITIEEAMAMLSDRIKERGL